MLWCYGGPICVKDNFITETMKTKQDADANLDPWTGT